MDFKTNRIERLMLVLSIFVGTTVVFLTTISDYTLNGILRGPVEVMLGLIFMFSAGFASVWTIYGVVTFIVKGFNDPSEVSQDFRVSARPAQISPEYKTLPKEEKPKVQKPPQAWNKQIDNMRSTMSKIRIRLTDKVEQKKLLKRPGTVRVIKFGCKYCGQKIMVPLSYAGKKGQCLKCNNVLAIPSVKKIKSATAKSRSSVNTRPPRPTFVSREKVQAQEMEKTRIWEAIQDEIVAKSPVAKTDTRINSSSRPEIEQKRSAKNEAKTELQIIAQSVLARIEKVRVQAEAKIEAQAEIKSKEMVRSMEKFRVQTEASIMAEILKKTEPAAKAISEAKSKAQALTPAAKPKTAAKAQTMQKVKPRHATPSSEFNVLEVMRTVKKNTFASMV